MTGIHSVVQQARRSIDELKGSRYTEDGDLLHLLLAEHLKSASSSGSVMLLFHSATAMPMCSPFPQRGQGCSGGIGYGLS